MSVENRTLRCLSYWQLSKTIRKFKKGHRNVKVLKKGCATTGCGNSYYWAEVEYES